MRTPRTLSRLDRSEPPRHAIVFDCASDRTAEHDGNGSIYECLHSWTAARLRYVNGRWETISHHYGSCQSDWLAFLQTNCHAKTVTHLIGHGIGRQLTLLGFWQQVENGDIDLGLTGKQASKASRFGYDRAWRGFLVTGDPPVIVACRLSISKATLRFCDVRNFTRDSLDEIAASLKVSPLDLGETETPVDPLNHASAWRRQVVCDWFTNWTDFLARKDLGSFKPTIAAQSMAAYRHKYLENDIHIHCDSEVLDLEREAYKPPFLLCPFVGQAPEAVWHFDVNSLYPSVARDMRCPAKLIGKGSGLDPSCIIEDAGKFVYVAQVRLLTDKLYPVKTIGGSTDFRSGKHLITLAGRELLDACIKGEVRHVGAYATYEDADLFSKWVADLHALRDSLRASNERSSAKMVKVLCLSLFGKFAQREANWEAAPDRSAAQPYCSWWETDSSGHDPQYFRSIAWEVQRLRKGGETDESCPAIAACVLAAARLAMRDIYAVLPDRSLYYSDTDSVFVNEEGVKALQDHNLIHDTQLGKLKLVSVSDDFKVWGPKHYRHGDSTIHAGIPIAAIDTFDTMKGWESSPRLDQILDSGGHSLLPLIKRELGIGTGSSFGIYGSDGWQIPARENQW